MRRARGVLRVLRLRVPQLLLVLAVLGACGDLRVKMGVYNTLDDAKRAGAIESGWIPEGVPASASELREGHLPDGRHWGVFAFRPANALPLLLPAEEKA